MSPLILLLAITSAHARQAPITFTARAEPAWKVIRDLDKATGLKLQAGPNVANEILLVSVKNANEQDLMDNIASVLDAEWVGQGAQRTLARTDAKLTDMRHREYANRLKQAADLLKTKADEAKSLPVWNDQLALSLITQKNHLNQQMGTDHSQAFWARYRDMERQAPAGRLLSRLVALLKPEDIASMSAYQRLVFSNHPTVAQRPLPDGAEQALAEFADEARSWSAVAHAQPAPGSPQEGFSDPNDFTSSIGPVLLDIRKQESSFGINLEVCDPKGVRGAGANTSLDGRPFGTGKLPKSLPTDAPVEMSSESQALCDFANNFIADHPKKEAFHGVTDPALREYLSDPEAHELLGLIPTDALLSIATTEDANLVANPIDNLIFYLLFPSAQQKLTVNAAKAIIAQHGMSFDSKPGWLMVRQDTPIEDSRFRFDRPALGKLLKSAFANHRLSLNDLAAYCTTLDCDFTESMSVAFIMFLLPDLASSLGRYESSDFLKLFGTLSDSQRTLLAKGTALRFGELTREQQALIAQTVYFDLGTKRYEGRKGETIAVDPSICCADGIPATSLLTANVESTPIVFASSDKPDSHQPWPQPVTAEELGEKRAYHDNPAASGMREPELNEFRPGTVRKWYFSFSYTPGVHIERELDDVDFDPMSKPVVYSDLPKDFRDRAEAKYQELKKMLARTPFVQRPASAPPP